MKNVETTQTTEQRSEEQLSKEERQEESLSDRHKRQAVADVLKAIGPYNERFRHEVVSAALAEVSKVTDKADKLIAVESEVRAICGRLDVKTKAVITVLEELSAVEGQTIGVDYGSDLLWDKLRDKEYVEAAIKEHPDDEDIACLAEVYELARFINNADSEPESICEKTEPPATEPEEDEPPAAAEEPKPTKPGEVEEEPERLKLTEIEQKVRDWLMAQPYEAKLAHTILNIGCIADCDLEKFAWSITQEYEDEVVSMIEKDVKSLPAEICFVTGIASRLIGWKDHF